MILSLLPFHNSKSTLRYGLVLPDQVLIVGALGSDLELALEYLRRRETSHTASNSSFDAAFDGEHDAPGLPL